MRKTEKPIVDTIDVATHRVNPQEPLIGVAAIVGAVPILVWGSGIAVIVLFAGSALYIHRVSFTNFVDGVLWCVAIILSLVFAIFLCKNFSSAFNSYHQMQMQNLQKLLEMEKIEKAKLQNKIADAEIALVKALPDALQYALRDGRNIEYKNFKIADWRSNVRTLHPMDTIITEEIPAILIPPKTPTFAELLERGEINPTTETTIIGYSNGEPVYDKWSCFYSLMVFGTSGSGKSTTIAYLAALGIMHGARILLIDPEWEESESLYNKLRHVESQFLCPVGADPKSAMRVLMTAHQELEHPSDFPMILIIDEFTTLARKAQRKGDEWEDAAIEMMNVVEDYAQRCRKRNRMIITIGQVTKATRAGGTETRASFAALACHRLPKQQAGLILDVDSAKECQNLQCGELLLMRSNSAIAQRISIPFITPADMERIAGMCQL